MKCRNLLCNNFRLKRKNNCLWDYEIKKCEEKKYFELMLNKSGLTYKQLKSWFKEGKDDKK